MGAQIRMAASARQRPGRWRRRECMTFPLFALTGSCPQPHNISSHRITDQPQYRIWKKYDHRRVSGEEMAVLGPRAGAREILLRQLPANICFDQGLSTLGLCPCKVIACRSDKIVERR